MTKHIQIEGYASGGGGGGGDADTLQGHPASDFAPAVHIHDDRYYTETEIGNLLSGKSNTGHTHDDRYYTETEIGVLLSGKADTGHIHDIYAQLAGRAGGQTLYGGAAAGEDLILYSTSHGTKGKIKFGTKHWYDEANDQWLFHNVLGDNYERAYLQWDSDIFKIGTEKGGSGVLRSIQVDADIEFLKTVTFDEPFYDIIPLPIGWAIDGTTPPGTLAILSSTNKARYRDFAGDANNDVFFEWEVPYGIDTAGDILFQVEGWITSATPPVNDETVKFTLAGVSIGDSEILSSALGTAVTVTKTFGATHVQYDRFVTALSTAITITGLAAGEIVIFKFTRDTTDTYAQAIGVGWLKVKYGTNPQVS
jgi:hypothetical protein